jgi:ubiquinone biosynthesis protein COQ9
VTARRKKPDDEALKRAIVEAVLAHAAFDGFTDRLLARAAGEVGADKTKTALLFPQGVTSLLEAYSALADADMEAELATRDLKAMKIRERIAAAVRARLALLRPHKEAARRAAAYLSLPPNLPLATKLLYNTVDAMWRAAGDTSTDFNFYTKRGILAGVYSSTLVRWFNDQSEGEADTEAFLAARIENVMQFERLKAQVRDGVARIFAQMPVQSRP